MRGSQYLGSVGVQIQGVYRNHREAAAHRVPGCAAIGGHHRADVRAGVQRVGIGGVEHQGVYRDIRQVTADVRPGLSAVSGLEHVSRCDRRGCIEAVIGHVGQAVIRAVHGKSRDRANRQGRFPDVHPGGGGGRGVGGQHQVAIAGANVQSRGAGGWAEGGDDTIVSSG